MIELGKKQILTVKRIKHLVSILDVMEKIRLYCCRQNMCRREAGLVMR